MKKTLIGLGIIAALSPAVASAQNFYIGGSLGQVDFGISEAEKAELLATEGVSVDDDNDTGFKIFAGYRAHENFAFEAFYADLADITLSDGVLSVDVGTESFGASALGIIPVSDNFELFGKVGFHAWDIEAEALGTSLSIDDGTDATYGVGAVYTVDQVSFRAEIERFEIDEGEVDMISAGIAFNF